MSAPHATQIVDGYLARLEVALLGAPPARRVELMEDVKSHIADARAALDVETDEALLAALDRLGDPAEIAGDATEREIRPTATATHGARWGWVELVGLLLTIVLWPAGAILVLLSPVWTQREKITATAIGAVTFVIGFPLFAPLMGLVIGPLVAGLGAPLAPMLIGSVGALPIVAAGYLAWRLRARDTYLGALA